LSEAKPRIQIPGFPDFADFAALNPGYGVSCEINRQNSSHLMMGFASLNPSCDQTNNDLILCCAISAHLSHLTITPHFRHGALSGV
jgi:hypothetical protein